MISAKSPLEPLEIKVWGKHVRGHCRGCWALPRPQHWRPHSPPATPGTSQEGLTAQSLFIVQDFAFSLVPFQRQHNPGEVNLLLLKGINPKVGILAQRLAWLHPILEYLNSDSSFMPLQNTRGSGKHGMSPRLLALICPCPGVLSTGEWTSRRKIPVLFSYSPCLWDEWMKEWMKLFPKHDPISTPQTHINLQVTDPRQVPKTAKYRKVKRLQKASGHGRIKHWDAEFSEIGKRKRKGIPENIK